MAAAEAGKEAAKGLSGLTEYIWSAIEILRNQKASTGLELTDKFRDGNEAFKGYMQFGSLSTFFGGLEQLAPVGGGKQLGPPAMEGGSLKRAMESEHCTRPDSEKKFDTSNGMTGVTSEGEWEFVNKPEKNREYASRGRPREPIEFAEFTSKMKAKNAELALREHPPMEENELRAGRLYTGVRRDQPIPVPSRRCLARE